MRAPATCPSILRASQRYSRFELVRFMGFACVYIPDFLVQAVVRGQRALGEGALALLGGSPPLWSVVAANPAAFAAGIQLGMTKAQVAQFGDVVGARDTRARSYNLAPRPLKDLLLRGAPRSTEPIFTPCLLPRQSRD